MTNYVDKFIKRLKSNKKNAVLIIIGIVIMVIIITIYRFFEVVDDIYCTVFSKSVLSDQQLKEQALEVSRSIADFALDITYSSETMVSYYNRYAQRVVIFREEFLKRGIRDEEFEMLYKHPTNPKGLQRLSLRLVAMTTKLRDC